MKNNPNTNSFFHHNASINPEVAEFIIRQLKDSDRIAAGSNTHGKKNYEGSIRKSDIYWISDTGWVSGMLSHFVNLANTTNYNYDLGYWADSIQYTEYNGDGSHYALHADTAESCRIKNHIRKLSISLCLSRKEDYDGGELVFPGEYICGKNSYKMDIGDVIVFSSDYHHKINPVTSGKRIALVGWYAGPPWR